MEVSQEQKKAVLVVASATAAVAVAVKLIMKKRTKRAIQPYVHRQAIPHPLSSVHSTHWRQLLSCGSSSDFVKQLNFDRRTFFDILLPRFSSVRPTVNYGSPYRTGPKTRGRKSLTTNVDVLGLVLRYLKSTGRQYELCGMFGLVPSTISCWVDFGLSVMVKTATQEGKELEVKWPTEEEIRKSSELLGYNRPNGSLLPNVFGVMDGGRMLCADFVDSDLQNAYYEGYTGNVEVTNLFVFNFFGEIIHAAVNYPGSWHDNKVVVSSGLISDKLSDEKTPIGYAILGDSAFVSRARVVHGKIMRARKSTETEDIPVSEMISAVDTVLQRAMPSERQSAEWGIRAFKAPFGRLRLPLPADYKLRQRLLHVCVHLYNLRVREVGLNQIRTVYGDRSESQQPWEERLVSEEIASVGSREAPD